VTTERATFTKAEREYVKGIVHNLSFQRFNDREIVQWLHDEKQIDVDRITISKIRNQTEKEAAKWYTSLRESGSKFVAIYKQRLDSILSYQKKLHEIINQCGKSPEIVLRAISELHRIEISLHTLMKELPGDVQIEEPKKKDGEKSPYINIDEIIPSKRDKILPVCICRCTGDNEGHYVCWKCLKAFCRIASIPSNEPYMPIRCPDCKVIVYDPIKGSNGETYVTDDLGERTMFDTWGWDKWAICLNPIGKRCKPSMEFRRSLGIILVGFNAAAVNGVSNTTSN